MSFSIPYLIYALNEKFLGRNTLEYFRQFRRVQWYSGQKLKEYQFEKLKNLLNHAYNYVNYYDQCFKDAGFDPNRMSSFNDFQIAPFLTKEDIKPHLQRFIAKGKKQKLSRYATSGSTGEPLIFYTDAQRASANKAAHLWLYDCWDVHIGDKEVIFWGNSNEISGQNVAKRFRDRLLNSQLLSAFRMGEDSMDRYVEALRRYRPKNLFGYAHSFYLLSRYAKNRNLDLRDFGIKVIFATAEVLHDFQRELIKEVFNAPVANCYGGRDSGLVAFECPYGRMHVNPFIYTEIIQNGRPTRAGEKGEIVITDLESYGMPFIRYRTGDEGVWDENQDCQCGRKLPIIKQVLGRDKDHIVSPAGELIHPLALEYIFREIEGIDYFKIIQKQEDEFWVNLAVSERFNRDCEAEIRNQVNKIMGMPVRVNFYYIAKEEIPAEGKYRFVVSEVIGKYVH
jgi:phenylacetate-CoA ligase